MGVIVKYSIIIYLWWIPIPLIDIKTECYCYFRVQWANWSLFISNFDSIWETLYFIGWIFTLIYCYFFLKNGIWRKKKKSNGIWWIINLPQTAHWWQLSLMVFCANGRKLNGIWWIKTFCVVYGEHRRNSVVYHEISVFRNEHC